MVSFRRSGYGTVNSVFGLLIDPIVTCRIENPFTKTTRSSFRIVPHNAIVRGSWHTNHNTIKVDPEPEFSTCCEQSRVRIMPSTLLLLHGSGERERKLRKRVCKKFDLTQQIRLELSAQNTLDAYRWGASVLLPFVLSMVVAPTSPNSGRELFKKTINDLSISVRAVTRKRANARRQADPGYPW